MLPHPRERLGQGVLPKPFPLLFAPPSRMIQNSFVDMENMFELFHEEQEVGASFLSPLPGTVPGAEAGAEARALCTAGEGRGERRRPAPGGRAHRV